MADEHSEHPQEGGAFIRDPKTGKLMREVEAPAEPKPAETKKDKS
jgi:hypothetical protein